MNYYLIGEHLAHSFSPELHRRFGRYEYECRELTPFELGPFLEMRQFSGLNVTVPYKQAVIPYLDRLDGLAAAIGSVNTVVNRDGVLWGYNTDFGGMLAALEGVGVPLADKTVLILGTGGTSRTAMTVCRALGAKRILRVSRTGREGAATYDEVREECRNRRDPREVFLINTTPVGMSPDLDGLPIDPYDIPRLAGVFDCVYNPLRTVLMTRSMQRCRTASGGLEMLVRQAALSCELFTGAPVQEDVVTALLHALERERENLVLIGLPGAGKTTVGRILAIKLRRPFVDLDEEIEKRAGKRIAEIFAESGEEGFRDVEAELVREIARTTGAVIATGGGTVLRTENVDRLKRNGRLIWLERPLEELTPSADRPLGDTPEKVRDLFFVRSLRYAHAADDFVSVSATPEQTADAVIRAL